MIIFVQSEHFSWNKADVLCTRGVIVIYLILALSVICLFVTGNNTYWTILRHFNKTVALEFGLELKSISMIHFL